MNATEMEIELAMCYVLIENLRGKVKAAESPQPESIELGHLLKVGEALLAEAKDGDAPLDTFNRLKLQAVAAEGLAKCLMSFKRERVAVQLGVPNDMATALSKWQEAIS